VKEPLRRPRRRRGDNIRMDLQVVGCGYMDWIGLAQNRDRWRTFVSAVMNLCLVFITQMKSVYSAVRAGALNTAVSA